MTEEKHDHHEATRAPLRDDVRERIPKGVDPPGMFQGKVSGCECGAQLVGYLRGLAVWILPC